MNGGPRRVGLFGGTFDPVHNAHLALAGAALDGLALDEVRWVPSGRPWQKLNDDADGRPNARPITPAADRVAMLQLALAEVPRFVLDPIETRRAGPSYTLDTVRELAAANPQTEWVLIIGQDQYAGLHTWHEWRQLLARVSLAVALRPGTQATAAPEVQAWPRQEVPCPMLDISATDIRRRVHAGADISSLVPPAVAQYIALHGLYRAAAGQTT